MTVTVGTIGQSLLNSELYNGLAAKDSELLTAKLANISANSGPSTDKKLEAEKKRLTKELQESKQRNLSMLASLEHERAEKERLAAAVVEKEALILEWMHSNESFKRLAQKYGKKLSVSDEQQQTDYRHQVIYSSEENPKYSETGLVGRVKTNLAAKPQ